MENFALIERLKSGENRIVTKLMVEQSGNTPFAVDALWDTGSTNCCISNTLAQAMSLTVVGTHEVVGFTGKREQPIYTLTLTFGDGLMVENVSVVGIDTSQSFNFIVGMDIILQGDLLITQVNGEHFFTFRLLV
jgi:hypothetical protein